MSGAKRYLITGAAGFIGSNLTCRLVNSGFEVLGVDNFNSYYSNDLKNRRVEELLSPHGVSVRKHDLAELGETRRLIEKFSPDTVIHLAAQPGVRTPLDKSYEYITNNIVAFSNVIQSTVELEIPNFLYASSSSVYGNSTSNSYSEDDQDLRPISTYGATKLANELLAPTFISGSQTRARGLRFFTVYGPWGRPDMAYFRIINSAINAIPFRKFGQGEVRRDFTYVDDITAMIEALSEELLLKPLGHSDVVNIGGGRPHSLNELIQEINSHFQFKIETDLLDDNPKDTKYTCANTDKLLELVGSAPITTMTEGVAKTLKWATRPDVRDNLQNWVKASI